MNVDDKQANGLKQWAQSQLAARGIKINGAVQLTHQRPWSTISTIPTTGGTLYGKTTRPELRYEVALTHALAAMGQPVPTVIAADTELGYLLMAGSGRSLRSVLQAGGDIRLWHTAVSQFAQMQIALIPQVDALLALGLPDRRLGRLPSLYEQLLQEKSALLIGQEDGLSAAQYGQLQSLIPGYRQMCAQLTAVPIPPTLHHDDFHDANIYIKDDQITFADWGEASIAHPFFSMIIVLRIAAYILKLDENDPALSAIRDAYLAQWQAFASPETLRKTFDLAQVVGMVNRALTWRTLISFMNDDQRAADADAVPGWLTEFLHHYPKFQANP